MSGIAGICRWGESSPPNNMEKIIDRMGHRGPWNFSHSNEGKLSISLVQFGGRSSFPRIAFSGKLFNATALKGMLKYSEGRSFASDGELVLALYQEFGTDFLSAPEGVYAFALLGEKGDWLLCRDPLGSAPLYFHLSEDQLAFASEIKALRELTKEYQEFPIGSYYSSRTGWNQILPLQPNGQPFTDVQEIQVQIRLLLEQAVDRIMGDGNGMGVYLSGGLDSSIIAALAARKHKKLSTFSVGMGGSDDLLHARRCAEFLGTDHQEYVYDLAEMQAVLPDVIYHLESFDAALVRSAVANYFLARLAGGRIREVLSGEGADELFLGYEYLRDLQPAALERETDSLLSSLHHTALQRGDRMSMAFGISAYTPFLDHALVRLARSIPASIKVREGKPEKWLLRDAFRGVVPEDILYRKKQKFSAGAGSSRLLEQVAAETISDEELKREGVTDTGRPISSKEELMYYRIFRQFYPEPAAEGILGHTAHL